MIKVCKIILNGSILKKTEKTQNLDSLILNLNSKALELAKNRDFDLANETVQLSISLSKNRELTKMLMNSYNTLGLIYNQIGNYSTAIKFQENSLIIANRIKDYDKSALNLMALGGFVYENK